MSKRSDKLLLEDMLQACEKIMSYTDGLEFQGFTASSMVFDATVRNIEILGEAAGRLSQNGQSVLAQSIPFDQVRGIRNRIAHGYFSLEPTIIWLTVKERIPDLLEALRHALPQVPED